MKSGGKIVPKVFLRNAIIVAALFFILLFFVNSRVAAVVGKQIIATAELEMRLNVVQFSYDLQFGQTGSYEPKFARQNKRQVLDQLTEEYLLAAEAEALASQEEQEQYADELLLWLKENLFHNDGEAYDEILARHKLQEADLHAYFSKNLLLTRLRQQVVADIVVSGEEVRQYYEHNKHNFDQPELIKVAHILVQEKSEAESIISQLAEGADFSLLAREHSLDEESAALGGSLEWFSRGQLEPTFEEAAFSLQPGEISPIIVTSHGYHIIKAEDRDAAVERSFEEVERQAADQALMAKQDAAWDDYRQEKRAHKFVFLLAR